MLHDKSAEMSLFFIPSCFGYLDMVSSFWTLTSLGGMLLCVQVEGPSVWCLAMLIEHHAQASLYIVLFSPDSILSLNATPSLTIKLL